MSHNILPAIIEGEGLASWFDLYENEDAGKNEHSRWEMSSMEPNKTDGGVERDVFDSEEELRQDKVSACINQPMTVYMSFVSYVINQVLSI